VFSFVLLIGSSLNLGNILEIFKNEFPASKAGTLGIYLGIAPPMLDDFKRNNMGNAAGEMEAVLKHWLATDENKSWAKLADAVKNCDHPLLANKFRYKK